MPVSFKFLCFLSRVVWFIIVEPIEKISQKETNVLKLTASKNNSNHKDDLHEDYKRFIILKTALNPLNFRPLFTLKGSDYPSTHLLFGANLDFILILNFHIRVVLKINLKLNLKMGEIKSRIGAT